MSNNAAFDQSIPVLTEVFSDQPAERSAPLTKPGKPGMALEDAVQGVLETRAVDTWTDAQWQLLERRLSERILQQLQGRVDFVLEQRLRDSMEEVLHAALAGLTEQLRSGLQDTIEHIVARAVAQELAHLQTLKK